MYLFRCYRDMQPAAQKAYIYNLIDVTPVTRHVGQSTKRQVTCHYRHCDEEGQHIPVCRKTFMETFGLTEKAIRVLVEYKKEGKDSIRERRGGIPRKAIRRRTGKPYVLTSIPYREMKVITGALIRRKNFSAVT